MLSAWHLWIIAAVVLFIAEVFTPTFIMASFGVGCLVSSLAALLDFGLKVQIAGFIAGTLAAFFGARPIFTRYCYGAASGVKTNVDALVGKTGRVNEDINLKSGTGRVLVAGDDWKGESVDGTVIMSGTMVVVIRVEGVRLIVKPLDSEE